MNHFSHCMSKGTHDLALFNQKTHQNSKGGLPPLRTCTRSDSSKDAQNQIHYVTSAYNLRKNWAYTLSRQVTGGKNFQVTIPLLSLDNLLGKPQCTQRLLIRCKFHMNQVGKPT